MLIKIKICYANQEIEFPPVDFPDLPEDATEGEIQEAVINDFYGYFSMNYEIIKLDLTPGPLEINTRRNK